MCKQLEDKFRVIHHDEHLQGGFNGWHGQERGYVHALMQAAKLADRPVLGETPFSLSKIMEPLQARGFDVRPVFIIESDQVTAQRYMHREGKPIPQGHLTRINTYRQRAREHNAFSGTSSQVLEYLKKV